MSAHKACYKLVPSFCGLAPDTAKILVAAFEEHEQKLLLKNLRNAEIDRMASVQKPDFSSCQDELTQMGQLVSDKPLRNQPLPSLSRRKTVLTPANLTIDDFHLVTVLGRGAFGKVLLATDKSSNRNYALKAIKKPKAKSDINSYLPHYIES